MNNLEAYKVWAPDDALWTAWAKPVLFAQGLSNNEMCSVGLTTSEIQWMRNVQKDTMIIVDLVGLTSVEQGLALGRMGYRPVPLFNGVHSVAVNLVPTKEIAAALFHGVSQLKTYAIRQDAPPAFLLDSRRMEGIAKSPGKFDNRWCVFKQDMPSAEYLIKHGIKKIIVRTMKLQEDLSYILLDYQKRGIHIMLCKNGSTVQQYTVAKPSPFSDLFHRFRVTMGLRRNPMGGFGAIVPVSNSTSSGYHRMG